jgi:hypothetical protein
MDNFYRTHHANHYKRTCLEFINYFTTMLTPLDPPRREKRNEKEEEEEDQEEEEKEEGDEPPSHLNLIWDEEEFGDDEDDEIWKNHASVMIIIFKVKELQRRMIHPLLLRQTIRILLPNKHLPFETISRFCSSLLVDCISTLQFTQIHDNFSLELFQAQEVNRRKSEFGARKLKFSKCFVSNQISGEGCI